MENKKRQLYQLFGELGIKEEEFKQIFEKWVKRYEEGSLEISPEDFCQNFQTKSNTRRMNT